METRKRNVAIVGSAALIAALGLGGAMTAQADTGPPPAGSQTEVEGPSDGPDVGPDVNANEPGHQDADNTNDSAEESSTETEGPSDGPDVGPDTNPNEPGHQDAGSVNDDSAE